jgi:hypothetical protein
VQAAAAFVLGPLLGAHLKVVGERPGPQGRAHVHVPGQRRGPAVAAELGGGEAVGPEAGTPASFGFGDADREQALPVHVAEVLDRKCRIAIVPGRTRRQHTRAEPARPVDQLGLAVGKAERCGIEDRRMDVEPVEAAGRHG